MMKLSFSGCGFRNRMQRTGMTKMERNRERRSAMATVMASGPNIFPSIPSSDRIGMKVRAMISSPKMLGFLHLHDRFQHRG